MARRSGALKRQIDEALQVHESPNVGLALPRSAAKASEASMLRARLTALRARLTALGVEWSISHSVAELRDMISQQTRATA